MSAVNALLFLGGMLLLLAVLASSISARLGVPLLLTFLGIGMLAGEEGSGGFRFDHLDAAFLISNLALAVILLDGGQRASALGRPCTAGDGRAGVAVTSSC